METQTEQTNKMKDAKKTGGLLFVGCLFIGMGSGFYFGNFIVGLFAGMGLGFIMMAVAIASAASRR